MPEGPKLSRPNATDEPGDLVKLPVAHERTKPENNLPLQLSSLIGRDKERAEAGGLLAERRLLTLTGPGGSGKTRLALAVAGDVADGFEDGVWWVALAPSPTRNSCRRRWPRSSGYASSRVARWPRRSRTISHPGTCCWSWTTANTW